MIIGTAGHIDHGKTTLVKALTGVDTDRLPEEKRRGITVELGFAPIELGEVSASVIDVPGHEAFVKTMVAGAAGIDVALLVIAADEGPMPQTREHLAILDLLEIPSLVVALTKSDLVDAEWISLVRGEVSSDLAESRWPGASIVECSSLSGAGLDDLRGALAAAARSSSPGAEKDLFRLPVDRCFTMKGTGTVVTGTVWSGSLDDGESVTVLPGNKSARVRKLQRHGHDVPNVRPGDRAAIALTGLEVSDVPRGSTLVTEARWFPTVTLDARVTLLGEGDESARIGRRSELRLHLAGADVGATVTFGEDECGSGRFVRLRLDSPIAARGGDRLVLRLPAPVGTIGGGIVLDPFPSRGTVTHAARAFESADAASPASRFACIVANSGETGISVDSLPVRIGVSQAEVSSILGAANCSVFDGLCFSSSAVLGATTRILNVLAAAETTFPLERGVQLESVSALAECDPRLAKFVIGELERDGAVILRGSQVSRAAWNPSLSPAHAKTADSLVHAICSGGDEPPNCGELVEKYGGEVPGLLRYLEREGRLVRVGPDRYYARGAVDSLIEKLRKDLEPGTEYAPSQLRDVLGFSRKYLIPFLEYCDQAGVTERKGSGRSLKSVG